MSVKKPKKKIKARNKKPNAKRKRIFSVQSFVENAHPADIASFLFEFSPEEAIENLNFAPLEKQADIFGYLGSDYLVELMPFISEKRFAKIITEMNADERADFFKKLSPEQQESLLRTLVSVEREDIRRLASYKEGTAGSIMTSDYATLDKDMTAAEALRKLNKEAPDKETIYRTYVVDENRGLLGAVRLKDLILAKPNTSVESIMESETPIAHIDDHQEDVAKKIARYDILALPVIDSKRRLVGIVTHDDAIDIVQQEATEDFHKTGTITKLEDSLKDIGAFSLFRARISWLLVLMFANIFSGAGIAYFEDTILAFVSLVFFLPLLIGSGGNAGSQSATLMVRALATGDVKPSDWGYMMGRELFVAGLLGLAMALAVSTIGIVRAGPEVALVVSLSMMIVVMIGSLVGLSLPFVLKKFNLDPATASAPLITSLLDALGVVIYFSIATAFLFPELTNTATEAIEILTE